MGDDIGDRPLPFWCPSTPGFVKSGLPPFCSPSRAIVTFARRPNNNLQPIGTPLPAMEVPMASLSARSCQYAEVLPFRHRVQSSELRAYDQSSDGPAASPLPHRGPRGGGGQQVSHHKGGHTASHITRNRGLYADKMRTHSHCHILPTRRRRPPTPHMHRAHRPATLGQYGHTWPIHGAASKSQPTALYAAAACLA